MPKITNLARAPRVLNVKGESGAPEQISLMPGEARDDLELYSLEGKFEKGLIDSGEIFIGEVPEKSEGASDQQAKVAAAEKRATAAEKRADEADAKVAELTSQVESLKSDLASAKSTGSNNRR